MVVADEAAGDIEEQLGVHALGEVVAIIGSYAMARIDTVVVGEASGAGRVVVVETLQQAVAEGGARGLAYEAGLRGGLVDAVVRLATVEERVEHAALI